MDERLQLEKNEEHVQNIIDGCQPSSQYIFEKEEAHRRSLIKDLENSHEIIKPAVKVLSSLQGNSQLN